MNSCTLSLSPLSQPPGVACQRGLMSRKAGRPSSPWIDLPRARKHRCLSCPCNNIIISRNGRSARMVSPLERLSLSFLNPLVQKAAVVVAAAAALAAELRCPPRTAKAPQTMAHCPEWQLAGEDAMPWRRTRHWRSAPETFVE